MAQGTAIEWTDTTWNVVVGCSNVTEGCRNCFARNMARRLEAMGSEKYTGLTVLQGSKTVWTGKVSFDEKVLKAPLEWKPKRVPLYEALTRKRVGWNGTRPLRVFVTTMGDPHHENVPVTWLYRMLAVIWMTPQCQYQWLTKRASLMHAFFTGYGDVQTFRREMVAAINDLVPWENIESVDAIEATMRGELPPNLWLGVSVELASHKDRIEDLRSIPGVAVRFLSCEPLLGDLGPLDLRGIGWVIVGGESGPKARPMHPDWARGLRDQCKAAGVPFFFKQWGEWAPGAQSADYSRNLTAFTRIDVVGNTCLDSTTWSASDALFYRVGKKAAGHLLDGVVHHAFPEVRP